MHLGIFSSIFGFYSVDASSTVSHTPPKCDNQLVNVSWLRIIELENHRDGVMNNMT